VHASERTGLETWFDLPGRAPPSRGKMAVVTWAALFPLVLLTNTVLGPVLEPVPLVPRVAVTCAAMVALMTWVVMPRLTRWLAGWLYPS
jgi:antibiotic biosynthesis monooxygenase (ABM) superfamily enzyme